MDGVIADTNPYHIKAFKYFFDKHGISYTVESFGDHMIGKHNSYIMSHYFGRKIANAELKVLEDEKESLFREIYAEEAKPITGLVPLLDALKTNDFSLGVATAAPKANMDLILDKLNIRSYFDSTLASEDVKLHKPHPEVYIKSIENLKVKAHNSVVFEDSASGVTAGLGANASVIAVLTSHQKHELPTCQAYINDYTEISVAKINEIITQCSARL